MTSMTAESVSTILVSCKQTRFHIETPNYRELDIEGLNITVTSGDVPKSAKARGKAKVSEGTEILNNAKLRLKAGSRYAVVGRNGTGKSTILRAIAEKLIPGIPEKTRIAILQQTNGGEVDVTEAPLGVPKAAEGPSVLDHVIDKATAKSELEREINGLSDGVNGSDPYGALRALRNLRHERMQKRLFVLDKDARLRSGARGMAARKALVDYEKEVAEYAVLMEQPEDEIPSDALQAETQEAADLLAELQLQVEPSRLADIESRAKKILVGLGFTDAYMKIPASSLSGGWRTRSLLAITLLQETDILILDEPTNFLDLLGIIWLQRYLQSLSADPSPENPPPTLLVVSHDRDFISLCTDLLIIKDKTLVYFHGDLALYEASQSEKRRYLVKMKEAQDKQRAHMHVSSSPDSFRVLTSNGRQETIRHNMAQGRKADDQNKIRQAKSRQKRLDERTGMNVSAKGTRFKLNRDMVGYFTSNRAEIEIPPEERGVSVVLPEPTDLRFPGPLISLEGVSFSYPPPRGSKASSVTPTLQDVTLTVSMGDRVGILGLNGSGKTTLIRLLVDETKPTKGTITRHPRMKLGYYSQHAVEQLQALCPPPDSPEPPLTALSLMTRDVEGALDEGDLRGLLGSLGLPGRIASDIPVRKLSGGQLVRLALARILWKRPQCLVLDEVTTHLDYETVTALREALRDWEGAVVLVSHDRWFMRGAIEGLREDEGEDEDGSDGSEADDEEMRRRVVYRLRTGRLVKLEGGVQEFEDLMERRVKKLLESD
ncbi:P-loop containing nucleoside triphosphate hydrolase protein [Echria macrotheca]|uniref:P-loop containing nucleoside triphosphate hydrolase protein n=1 Tax=Echria macrotheca TaxID=438768 RepID=A0AAJ0B7H7_9PEZI|nr:P-loop containing nucleoside triphosphate hydrolase protein [Echria macrotheca]